MIPRPILRFLVFSLPILVVAFGVLMGGAALAEALHDAMGSRVLRWVAMGCLMLLVGDAIALVVILGLKALREDDDTPPLE